MGGKQRGFPWAMVGFLVGASILILVTVPFVVAQFKTVSELGREWGIAYLALLGGAVVMFIVATVLSIHHLVRAGRIKQADRTAGSRNPMQMPIDDRDREIEDRLARVKERAATASLDEDEREKLKELTLHVEAKRQRRHLELVVFGEISSGKSSLLNLLAGRESFETDVRGGTTVRRAAIEWPGGDNVSLIDTPGLAEVNGAEHVSIAAKAARDADLVLLVTDGPLKEVVFKLLRRLQEMEKPVLVCLNKSDLYTPEEQSRLISQIRSQITPFPQVRDVVPIQARTQTRTRIRVLTDGSEVEEAVERPANISRLAERMISLTEMERDDLLTANLLLQARGLEEQARQRVLAGLDQKAWRTVRNYMGINAAVAASPWPVIDVVGGIGVSTKMIMDLAEIYGQKFDLAAAKEMLGRLGYQLGSIIGMQAIGPIAGTISASLMKTVPGIGTVAGATVQMLTQVIMTRWIGGLFIAYFRNEMQWPEGGMAQAARREWDVVTSAVELRKLWEFTRTKLGNKT